MLPRLVTFYRSLAGNVASVLAKGGVHLLASMVLAQVVGILVRVFLARYLGPDALGHIAVIQAVLTLAVLGAGFGIMTSVLKFASEPVAVERKEEIFRLGLMLTLGFSILAALAMLAMTSFTGVIHDRVANGYLRVLSIGLPFAALLSLTLTYFQALKQIVRWAKVSFHIKWVSAIFVVAASYWWGLDGYVAGTLLLGVACAVAVMWKGAPPLRFFRWNPVLAKRLLTFGVWSVLANAASQIVTTADVMILSTLLGQPEVVGIYAVAVLGVSALHIVPTALFDMSFPYMSEKSVDRTAMQRMFRTMVTKTAMLVAAMCAVAYLGGGFGIPLVFGDCYEASVAPFHVRLIGFFFWAVGGVGGRTLLAMGKPNLNLYIVLADGIVNIALNVVLIREMGVLGAAWAASVTFFVRFLLTMIFIRCTLFGTRRATPPPASGGSAGTEYLPQGNGSVSIVP
jgi:O-antigen/teichoic acid export membrane protein